MGIYILTSSTYFLRHGSCIHDESNNESEKVDVSNLVLRCGEGGSTHPYSPSTSAKMRMRTMETKTRVSYT